MQGKYKIFDMRLKGYKLKEAMFNGTLMYVYKPYVLYTIDKSNPNDLLNSGGYLPANYETFATKIFINGEETTDLNIEVGQINKIRIHYEEGLTSMSFKDTKIKTLSYVDTTYFTTMENMFYGCKWLEKINANAFITDKVTDMSYMFRDCSSLISLDLSSFNTKNVKFMSYMFEGCSSLISLDLSSFNTRIVTSMSYMFRDCSSLKYLDISNFNTGMVGGTFNYQDRSRDMFKNVPKLDWNYSKGKYTEFFLSESDTGYDYDFPWLENCILYSIKEDYQTDQSTNYWDKVDRYYSQYDVYPYLPYEYGKNDNYIESIEVMTNNSYVGFSSVKTDIENIQVCDVRAIKIKYNPEVKSIKFKGDKDCPHNIKNLKRLRGFHLTDMKEMFANAPFLEYMTTDISNWDTSGVTDMSKMFYDNSNSLTHMTLKSSNLDLSNWDTSNVTNMSYMFRKSELSSLKVSNWDTSNVTNMSYMFDDNDSLKKLDLSSWNTKKVTKTNCYHMFYSLSSLEVTIDDDLWNPEMTKEATNLLYGKFTII